MIPESFRKYCKELDDESLAKKLLHNRELLAIDSFHKANRAYVEKLEAEIRNIKDGNVEDVGL